MNLILCLTILIAVGHIKCDLPIIKVNITANEDQFITATKVLFAKLDWLIVEIDGITKRLNKQDEIIHQLPTKTDISEVVKTDVVELNERIFLKLNQHDENFNQLRTKVELINTNITELNQQIFQKLQQQDEKINQLHTKAEIDELMKLSNKHEAEISKVLELNQQIFQKMNLQEELITKSSNDIVGVNATINEMSANQSLLFQKSSKGFENVNVTITKLFQNQLLYNQLSKSTETINIMLPNKPINEMGNWLVILRRQDGSENFDRNWLDYQNGFGNPTGEFFIGLEKLHAITTNGGRHELLIILEDFEGITKYANYDHFVVGNETEKYELQKLGHFDGDAGDSMQWHLNMKFSTKDQDNDLYFKNCAALYKGGWWFDSCGLSHLTGPYYDKPKSNENEGIVWASWYGWQYSLKFVEMMVRPKA